ncbi:TRAP transporter small permease [Salsuginibacillus kocurii]|uniref:TRAP transporter small permease n=1 Tax=Salsuginibacillus kocurii TaxID=427078 RepID=UPI00037B5F9F|nr:TRAP transporter small permease [Salsuginibacillus kocurii]
MQKKKEVGLLQKCTNSVNYVVDTAVIILTLSLLIVVLLQIISRPLDLSTVWTEELTRFIFIWIIFLGVAIGFRNDESPRITFFIKLLPRSFQNVLAVITTLLTICFFVLLFVTGLNLMAQQLSDTSAVLRITLAWIGLCVPLCAVLSIFNLLQSVFSSSNALGKGGE